jgi:ATP-dependent Zn protease
MAGSYISYEAVAAPGNLVAKVLSNDDARRRVDAVLTAAHDHVVQLLEANRVVVERLRDALLAHDELVGDEIIAAITDAGATLDLT